MTTAPKRLALAAALTTCAALNISQKASAAPWITAYYPTWTITSPAPANIDMRAITHLVFFSLTPTAAGGLTDTSGGLIAANAQAVKATAHGAGKKVLICIGGGGSGPQFEGAIAPASRAAFVENIVNWVTANGYDGVDIDMEPVTASDAANYEAFIEALRAALDKAKPGLLLTAAAEPAGVPKVFAAVQKDFDQINVMTYDLSGNWDGWVSWHNSNLYTGGLALPGGRPLPSCDSVVQSYLSAGIPASKLAIGAAFYGNMWTGVTGPRQALDKNVTTTDVTYADIMTTYYPTGAYHWDSTASAPYLSLETSHPPAFISYDDPALCAAKVKYVKAKGLGGLVCWSIGQQYMPDKPAGQQNPLLTAIYTALNLPAAKDTPGNRPVVRDLR
jgi:chitinase